MFGVGEALLASDAEHVGLAGRGRLRCQAVLGCRARVGSAVGSRQEGLLGDVTGVGALVGGLVPGNLCGFNPSIGWLRRTVPSRFGCPLQRGASIGSRPRLLIAVWSRLSGGPQGAEPAILWDARGSLRYRAAATWGAANAQWHVTCTLARGCHLSAHLEGVTSCVELLLFRKE